MIEPTGPRVTGQQIEQLGQVLAEGFATREQAEIAVDTRRADVVVPGRQMAVAPDPVRLLTHDETRLAVRLVSDEPVHDVSADRLERARPPDVRFLVEARLQLDEHRDLLAPLGGEPERLRDRRGRAHPVERHLDRQYFWIDGRLVDEAGHRVERVIRMVHQHVAAADGGPEVGRGLESRDRLRRQRTVFQSWQIHRRVELEQIREGDEPARLVEVRGLELERLDDGREDLGRQIHVVLQADCRAHPPVAQTLLDRRQ